MYFAAAATASGLLYTWRSGGNPLLPPLALGCGPPVGLSAQGQQSLLVTGADGQLLLLDLEQVGDCGCVGRTHNTVSCMIERILGGRGVKRD